MASLANEPKEAKRRDAAFQISLELLDDIFRQGTSLLCTVLSGDIVKMSPR